MRNKAKTQELIINAIKKQQTNGNVVLLKYIKEETKMSYATVLKHIDILTAEKRVKVQDLGNIKIVTIPPVK